MRLIEMLLKILSLPTISKMDMDMDLNTPIRKNTDTSMGTGIRTGVVAIVLEVLIHNTRGDLQGRRCVGWLLRSSFASYF